MARRTTRPAFSLLELLIVLAILVAVTALAVPTLRAIYGSHKLAASVDAVRAAWALARSAAADQDRPYRFAIEPNGRHFRIAPDDESYWSGGNGPGDDPDGKGVVMVEALPPGVRFVLNGDPGELPSATAAVADAKAPPSGQWEKACVIMPDGTSPEDVRIVFSVQGSTPTQLQLRGLTGVSYVTKVK
jgi:prepilin-type N-terminal cleavage/methylation domain-containing protein